MIDWMCESFAVAYSGYLQMNVVRKVPSAGIRYFMSLPQLVSIDPRSRTEVQSIS